jgi:hypothetical protein
MEFHAYADQYIIATRLRDMATNPEAVAKLTAYCAGGWEEFFGRRLDDVYQPDAVDPVLRAETTGNFGKSLASEAELLWRRQHCRYYKIWPDYVAMLADTRMSVPFRLWRMPVKSFAVLFPKGHELRVGGTRVESFLFSSIAGEDTLHIMADRIGRQRARSLEEIIGPETYARVRSKKFLFIDLHLVTPAAVIEKLGGAVSFSSSLFLPDEHDDTIVEDFMEEQIGKDPHAYDYFRERTPGQFNENEVEELLRLSYRVSLAVCFLATGGDKVVDPDTLNKDFRAYLEAVNRNDREAISSMRRRAAEARGGNIGFVIGKREAVLGRRAYDVDTTATTDAEGRQLQYRHVRNAHFHKYWTGPGRTVEALKFIRMLVVRPDLPPDPRAGGYRTLGSRAEMDRHPGGAD